MYLATRMPRDYFKHFYLLVDMLYDTNPWPSNYLIVIEDTARKTLKKALELRLNSEYEIVPAWMGYRKDLDQLKKEFNNVALPWWRPRNLYLEEGEGKEFIYLGYKNLDELYHNPPKILISGIALHAAVSGIDLKERERRPTKLTKFTGVLTEDQIKAAQRNFKLLRGDKNG